MSGDFSQVFCSTDQLPDSFPESSPRRQIDCDARHTIKTFFGFKSHVKADGLHKFIVEAVITTANVHDLATADQ